MGVWGSEILWRRALWIGGLAVKWGLWSVQGCPEGPEGVQKMSRRCPEDVQKVSRRLEKNVGTSRGSSAGVQKASGVLPKVSLSQVKP